MMNENKSEENASENANDDDSLKYLMKDDEMATYLVVNK